MIKTIICKLFQFKVKLRVENNGFTSKRVETRVSTNKIGVEKVKSLKSKPSLTKTE